MTYEFDGLVQFDPAALDKMYQDCFGYKVGGTFVEVGAYDGLTYSHTVGLARLGWRGVYIEPRPDLAAKCLINHAEDDNVTVVPAAAGSFNGWGNIWIDDNAVCGSTGNHGAAPNGRLKRVQVRTLDTILNLEGIFPHFDLLSLDVEFNEVEVLKGFNLRYWNPKMMIIECCEKHPEPKHTWAAPLRQYCEDEFPTLGYRKIYADAINSIFVRP